MNTQKQIAVMVALLFVFAGSCAAYTVIELPYRAVDQLQWHEDQSIKRGALLFANNCRTCHGLKGEGSVGPPLNTPGFQDQDPLVLARNKALLKRTLECGRAGTLMPAWLNTNQGPLNERQIEHLVNLITQPATGVDAEGNPVSKGWEEAVHFAENLNHETVLVVGGDTLGTIARDHETGINELKALNPGLEADTVIKKGTRVNLPASAVRKAQTYEVKTDRETLRKLAASQSVGAMILADLNGIGYTVDKKSAALTLKTTGDITRPAGLIPGAELKLPDGATYTIRAEETLDSIAKLHNLSASDLASLNRAVLSTTDPEEALEHERRLTLPANAVVVVQAGQTPATIAATHGLQLADLKTASGDPITAETVVGAGQQLSLPANARYIIQTGDTLAKVAAGHGISEAGLAGLNNLQPGAFISPAVVIALPKVDRYAVQGQDLEAIAKTLAGVTAKSIADAQEPPVEPTFLYAIGSNLVMPADAYGSAPPDATNPGTACVEHAVTKSGLEKVLGTDFNPTAPSVLTREVTIEGNANDWTIVADGQRLPANRGAVSVSANTTINFKNVVGLHTITTNDEVEVEQFDGTDTYQFTAQATAPSYKITCDFHPDMIAYVFVQ